MIVVGARRLGHAAENAQHPVGGRASQRASTLPRGRGESTEHTAERLARLIVGVDGSASSHEAVKFALEEAEVRRASLHAVWARPAVSFRGGEAGLEERTRLLTKAIAACSTGHQGVKTTQEVRRGHPVENSTALLDRARSGRRKAWPWWPQRHAPRVGGPWTPAPSRVPSDHRSRRSVTIGPTHPIPVPAGT